jgi:CBS domain-containing protein
MPVKVKEIMQEPAIVVGQDESIEYVARTMLQHQVTCVGVVDGDGRLVGVIREEEFTVRDRHLPFSIEKAPQLFGRWVSRDQVEDDYASAGTRTAREVMARGTGLIGEDERLSQALPALQAGHCLLVMRGDRPVGMLTRHDLLKLVASEGRPGGERSQP